MKQLTCEMCGGTDLIKQDGVFVCQNCGTKYSVEEAKKMMADGASEVTNTVKLETNKSLNNLYQLARRAKETEDTKNALKYYDMILIENPNDWEAILYTAYFTAMQSTIASISSNCQALKSKVKSILLAIKGATSDTEERLKYCQEAYDALSTVAEMLFLASKNKLFEHYERFQKRGTSAYSTYLEHCEECMIRVNGCYSILNTFGDVVEELFEGESFDAISRNAWKKAMAWNKEADDLNNKSDYVRIFKNDQLTYTQKIKGKNAGTNDLGIDGVDSITANRIANLVKSGQVIHAIKVYCEETGADLAEAKTVIDNYKANIGDNNSVNKIPEQTNNNSETNDSDNLSGIIAGVVGIVFLLLLFGRYLF